MKKIFVVLALIAANVAKLPELLRSQLHWR
jgi:hypothetical protein